MKILFCATDRPGHIASGPNAWIQRLIPDLRLKYNLEVEVLFVYSGDISLCPTINFFMENELPFHTINRKKINFIADQVKEILRITKKGDFTVLVANLVVPAFYCAKFLKKSNVPVLGVLHSNDLFYKSVIENFIESSNDNFITHAVAVSNFLGALASEKNTNRIHIETIPCGTPTANTYAEKPIDTLSVLYAGRLEIEQKQIMKLADSFLNASRKNPKLKFTIVGSGTQENNLKKLLDENKDHSVCYKGAVSPSNIGEEMAKHHVFTLLSDFEGMPVALMEGMSSGLVPVCLQEESGINEIIKHGVNGFVVKNRGQDYLEKLSILSSDFSLWESMSQESIKAINSEYSSDIVHAKWAVLLKSFETIQVRPIQIPSYIRLKGDLLHYGDNRKPEWKDILIQDVKKEWSNFKKRARPRARLRSLFKRNEK